MLSAPCASVDPEIFFPDPKQRQNSWAAKKVCARCPYKAPCVLWAIEHHEKWGIWGGLGPDARQLLAVELGFPTEAA